MCQKSGRQTKPANFGTFWQIFQDPVHIFQNRFLRWNRELKPVVLSTMNPINGTNFFLSYKGGGSFLKSRTPQLKPLKIENFNDFPKTYIIYPNNYYQPNCKCDFFNFQPTLLPITSAASVFVAHHGALGNNTLLPLDFGNESVVQFQCSLLLQGDLKGNLQARPHFGPPTVIHLVLSFSPQKPHWSKWIQLHHIDNYPCITSLFYSIFFKLCWTPFSFIFGWILLAPYMPLSFIVERKNTAVSPPFPSYSLDSQCSWSSSWALC